MAKGRDVLQRLLGVPDVAKPSQQAIDLAEELPADAHGEILVQSEAEARDEMGEQPLQRFEVKLPHSPTDILEAVDKDDAWVRYKTKQGIIATEWKPEVTLVE